MWQQSISKRPGCRYLAGAAARARQRGPCDRSGRPSPGVGSARGMITTGPAGPVRRRPPPPEASLLTRTGREPAASGTSRGRVRSRFPSASPAVRPRRRPLRRTGGTAWDARRDGPQAARAAREKPSAPPAWTTRSRCRPRRFAAAMPSRPPISAFLRPSEARPSHLRAHEPLSPQCRRPPAGGSVRAPQEPYDMARPASLCPALHTTPSAPVQRDQVTRPAVLCRGDVTVPPRPAFDELSAAAVPPPGWEQPTPAAQGL